MKKLLTLIGTISIIGSGASTVVACGDDSSSSRTPKSKLVPAQLTPDQKKADAIKDKIKHVAVDVPVGTNPKTTNADTIKAIKKALQTANPALTNADLTTLTFAKATLKLGVAVPDQTKITVGAAIDTLGLKVTLLESDQEHANLIRDKISWTFIMLPKHIPAYTGNPVTIKALKVALQKFNPSLTAEDLTKLTFSANHIALPNLVLVTVTVNTGVATKLLIVWSSLP